MIAILLLAALPVQPAYATAATYNFQAVNGVAVAPGITTDILNNCSTDYFVGKITVMTTAAFGCTTNSVRLSTPGPILDVWYNTAYTADTFVTGTTLKIHLREGQTGVGQSWTAGMMLMYVDASGTVTNFNGAEVTQVVNDNDDLDFILNLSGQSATIPAGSKLGIRIRAVSGNSNSMRTYFGSTAGQALGVSGQLTVDEKQTTMLTVSSATGTYGGTVNLSATLTDSTATGIAGQTIAFSLNGSSVGSAVTNASGLASLSDISLTGINANTYPAGVTASFAGGTGYVASNDSDSLTVNPKSLTITGVIANNKTYDRTTSATFNLSGAALVGVVSPDVVTINSGSATGTFASANAGTHAVTASGFGLTGAGGNYVLSAQPTVPNATITPKGLTITGVTANNKTYNQTNTATLNLGGAALVGVISPDAVTINSGSASATFASASAGTHAITASGFGLNGAAGNYVLSAQPTIPDATITPKGLTASGVVANNKTYDRTTAATFNLAGASLVGVISPDVVNLDGTSAVGTFASANAGTHAVTASGFTVSNANYVLSAQPTVPNATINPKGVTITGVTVSGKTYDQTNAATLNLGGAAVVGSISPDVVNIDSSAAAATFASANAGTHIVTATGFGVTNANYVLSAQPTIPNATITPKGLTASGVVANGKVYDRTTAATFNLAGASLAGVLSPDVVSLDGTSAVGTFASANAGTHAVTASGFGVTNANYVLSAQPTVPNATITPKGLTITGAVANGKVYDRTTAATFNLAGASLVGVVSPDPVTINSAAATGTFASANAGTHVVTVSGFAINGAAGNYVLSAQPTVPNATITPVGLTITGVTANDKTYDRTTAATLNLAGAALVGVISPDAVTINSSAAAGTFVSANAGLRAVTASGFALNGAAGNYVLSAQPTVPSATINPKSLTITGAVANDKTYDRTTAATFDLSGASLDGVISPDVVNINSAGATGTFANANAGTWSVTASGFSVTNANYVLSAQPLVPDATINPKDLTISGVLANDKAYDQTDVATFDLGSASLVGVVSPDAVSIDASGATATFASANAGTHAVSVAGFGLTGAAGNYVLASQPTVPNATIDPKGLTVLGMVAEDKPYDGNTDAVLDFTGASLDGVLGGDDVTLDTSAAVGTFASATIGSWTVTASGLTLDGAAKDNYSLTQPTTTASILGATATVTGILANDKVYDGTVTAALDFSGATLVGILPGDDVTLETSGASAAFADENVGVGKEVTITGLTLSGPDAGKYLVDQPTATADITVKDLTVTANANNRVYNGTTTATVTFTTDAVVGDAITVVYVSANFDTKNVGVGKTVTVNSISLSGADAGNYNLLNSTATDTANISAKGVNVTASDKTKAEGDPDPVFTFVATGFVGADTFVTAPGCHVVGAHSLPGTYDIVCSGGNPGPNYVISSYVDGTLTVQEILKVTLRSTGTTDGWVLESTETSGIGGTKNNAATTLYVGDNAGDKQYRSILSFNTAGLPDNAVIRSVTLKVRKQSVVGSDPFVTHGNLIAEIVKPFFGSSAGLAVNDFQAAANKIVGSFGAPVSNWFSLSIAPVNHQYVNLGGTTQFRLRFQKDDDDDLVADYLKLFSGNYGGASARPTLIIEYTVP
jgi:hypothetical protein